MTEIAWGHNGHRLYETGVGLGVLYLQDDTGIYRYGYAWDGISAITESPSGAEVSPIYADNRKYNNLISTEEFGGTIEAYTFPPEFLFVDGAVSIQPGAAVMQQKHKMFGLSYITLMGNDTKGTDFGYKLHLVWGALAAPSEKGYATVSDSPEALTFSWDFTTTPVKVGAYGLKPTSHIVIDSTKVPALNLEKLQDILYGSATTDARLPSPAFVITYMLADLANTIDGGGAPDIDQDTLDGGLPTFPGPGTVDGGGPGGSTTPPNTIGPTILAVL